MDNFVLENGQPFAFQHWQALMLVPGWEEFLEEYQIEAVLLSPTWPLAQLLEKSPEWEVLYQDEVSLLLEKVN
jgi:hypothetical protein